MALIASLVALVWLLWILAAPLLPAPLAAGAYAIGSLICHQRPERSFHIAASQLPVCARCLSIYAGAAGGALIGAVSWSWREGRMTPLAGRTARWLVGLGAIPTMLTVGLELLDVWRTTNVVRAVAGLPFGFGVALVVAASLATLHYRRCAPPRPTAPNPPPPI